MAESVTRSLLLVDGSSYLYRAYYALPDLRSPQGEPSGALYGVLNMMRHLLDDYKPDYAACVFDAKGPTFRHQEYPAYKAQRPPMPPDLVAQIAPIHQGIAALGWPVLELGGVEADDVIGTLTRQARTSGMEVLISTGDKDMVQLVDEGTRLINTLTRETTDSAGASAKYGITPAQFLDYLTLIGDSADNVPGVPQVGPKTALKWLQHYGSLDQLLAHSDFIPGRAGANLRATGEWLPQARRLLTIRTDLALPWTLSQLAPGPLDSGVLQDLVARFGLRSWRTATSDTSTAIATTTAAAPVPPLGNSGLFELGRGSAPALECLPTPAPAVTPDYQTITSRDQLELWLERLSRAELTALDSETTGLDQLQARLVGLSWCCDPTQAAYLPLGHEGLDSHCQLPFHEALECLRPWLENPAAFKVGQNLKFDQHILANHGITLRGIAHDTLLQSYLLEAHLAHDLESLMQRHLGRKGAAYSDLVGKGVNAIPFAQVALESATHYAAEDAEATLQLHHCLYPRLVAQPRLLELYHQLELPLQQVLWRMERRGVCVDGAALTAQSEELAHQLYVLEARTHSMAGHPFNLNSPKQVQNVLYLEQGLPCPKKTPKGDPSTSEEVLQKLALDYPLPKLILEYRVLAKLKSTYTDALPRRIDQSTGRVHTNFGQAVTVTGRLSSSEPNLQNIPVRTPEGRRIRAAFVAPAGWTVLAADYSQIELRLMAHLSQDPGLLAAFAAGQDVHRATAGELFGVAPDQVSPEQRRAAKVINFGLIYGMSAFGLAAQLGLERSAAQSYMERYFQRYPGVARYMELTRAQARAQGWVETLFGRQLWFPELSQGGGARRQAAERAAINAPLQGSAADLIKRAMIAVQDWLDQTQARSRLILQVHDELVLEVAPGEEQAVQTGVIRLMQEASTLSVPLLVEVGSGPNWEAAH